MDAVTAPPRTRSRRAPATIASQLAKAATAGVAAAACLVVVPAVGAAPPPATAVIERIAVRSPAADRAEVVLHVRGPVAGGVARVAAHRLTVGGVAIPVVGGPGVATRADDLLEVPLRVDLGQVPEAVLDLDPRGVSVVWDGRDRAGKALVSAAGTIDLTDPRRAEWPADTLRQRYTRVSDAQVAPRGLGVGIRVLLALYNPFAFDVVSSGFSYRVAVGGDVILASRRSGFRLHARQWSDVLIEDAVPLADAAGALAAFAAGGRLRVDGVLGIRTAAGDRAIALQLETGR